MSLRAMTWALEQAPVNDPGQLLVLWALSDRARDNGTAAWPTQQWLAERARCSDRSVRRYLRELEQAGIIRRGDQELVAHMPRDRRPVVWDLVLTAVAAGQSDRADSSSGRTPGAERPDRGGQNGRTLLSAEPSLTPYGSETVLEPSNARENAEAELGFDAFWHLYPRRTGKAAAAKAWTKAVRAAAPTTIRAGAKRYAEDPNRDPAFTKHPATWLNAGCWDDDPLPARRTSGSAANQQHHDELFAAAARRAAAAEGEHLAIGGGR